MDYSRRTIETLVPEHALARLRISPATAIKSPKEKESSRYSPYDFIHSPPLDTSTLAAHDFDVDVRSGFMPPEPPISRLPSEWQEWETVLQDAIDARLKLGDNPVVAPEETDRSALWRDRVQNMPILEIGRLRSSERNLRRAHLVLAWVLHFYVHTHPPDTTPIVIPKSLTLPLLAVSRELDLPPVLTYSDTVLYNWRYSPSDPSKLESITLFTGTKDEEHFFLTSAYIELAGVEALSLMQKCFDEAFVADSIALRRIASYLKKLSNVIKRLAKLLDAVREGCDPKVFYNEVRPWLRGEDSGKRPWIFLDENDEEVDFGDRRELSGPSAGQSALIHAFDIFLGVDHTPRRPPGVAAGQQQQQSPQQPQSQSSSSAPTSSSSNGGNRPVKSPSGGFLERMQAYMPRHHRAFMNHLKAAKRPIRTLVSLNATNGASDGAPSSLVNAYDATVLALKGLRDTHIRIATLYIVNQMPRKEHLGPRPEGEATKLPVVDDNAGVAKGTGGSDLVPFLKGSRDDTTRTLLNPKSLK
ncbi:hypothetical protein FRC17_006560 [Serendipita sp. 399]|nr:hypothetical protein FRC17_006560 [Serendipita sp. 399]